MKKLKKALCLMLAVALVVTGINVSDMGRITVFAEENSDVDTYVTESTIEQTEDSIPEFDGSIEYEDELSDEELEALLAANSGIMLLSNDFDVPTLEEIKLGNIKSGDAGDPNNHHMNFSLRAYDISGISEVYVHYGFIDDTGFYDNNSYLLYYGNNQFLHYQPLNSTFSSNGMNATFEADIDLNIRKEAGTLVILGVQVIDTCGNSYFGHDDLVTNNSLPDNNIAKWNYKKHYNFVSLPNQITIKSVTYSSSVVTPQLTRKSNGVTSTSSRTTSANNTFPAEDCIFIEPEFDFSGMPGFDPSTISKVTVKTDGQSNYVLSDANWQSPFWSSGDISGRVVLSDLVMYDYASASTITSSVNVVAFRFETYSGEIYEVPCPSSMNTFHLINWHQGHDLSNVTFSNVKYYVNGSTVPYEQSTMPQSLLHYGDQVVVELEVSDYAPKLGLFFQLNGFTADGFNVEAYRVGNTNTFRSVPITIKDDEMKASIYWVNGVSVNHCMRLWYEYEDRDVQPFYYSFMLVDDDGSCAYPTNNICVNYNYYNRTSQDDDWYLQQYQYRWDQMMLKVIPGYDDTDYIFDELDKINTSNVPSEMNGQGWRLFECTGSYNVGNVTKTEIFRNKGVKLKFNCFYEAVYDYEKYPVEVTVVSPDGWATDRFTLYLGDNEQIPATRLSSITFANAGSIQWNVTSVMTPQTWTQMNVPLSNYVFHKDITKTHERVEVSPVTSNPLVLARGYYLDSDGGLFGIDEWVGYTPGSESIIENYITNKYRSLFAPEAGFIKYTAQYDGFGYNLVPIVTKKYTFISTREYNNGTAETLWVDRGSWMSDSEIQDAADKYVKMLVPAPSNLTFEEWTTDIDINGAIANIFYKAQYDKNIIQYRFSLNGDWWYDDASFCVEVDKDATDNMATAEVVKALNATNKAKQFGVTSWFNADRSTPFGMVNANWNSVEAVMNYNGQFVLYRVFDGTGMHNIEFDEIPVSNGDVIKFPSKIGNYENIDWRMVTYFDSNGMMWDYYNGSQTTDPLADNELTIDNRSFAIDGLGHYIGTENPDKDATLNDPTKNMPEYTTSSSNGNSTSITVGKDGVQTYPDGSLGVNSEVLNAVKDSVDNGATTIEIEMGAADVIPASLFEYLKNHPGVTLIVKKAGYYWTINSNDIAATKPVTINFKVDVNANVVPQGLVNTLANNRPTTQLSLAHNGTFGLKATLTVMFGDFGKNNAGQYGNMYYYDSDHYLVFQNAGQFTADGELSLPFSHASDYVIVVGENETYEAVEDYKDESKHNIDLLIKEDDSEEVRLIISLAIKEIEDYVYKPEKTFEENQAEIDEIIRRMNIEIEKQREKDAENPGEGGSDIENPGEGDSDIENPGEGGSDIDTPDQDAIDTLAANEVIAKINAIGIVFYDKRSKAKIDDARSAYEALTDSQKAKISASQYKKLTDAEKTYAGLEKVDKDIHKAVETVVTAVKIVIKTIKSIFS